MDDEMVLELIKAITEHGTQLKALTESVAKVDERMTKLEALREQDIKQNEKIEQILLRLQQGNTHFEKIEERLTKLEMADGKKAKEFQKQIWGIAVATFTGAILGNIGGIIGWLGGGK